MKKNVLLLTLLFCMTTLELCAQAVTTVTGKVYTGTNEALIGVNIILKGTTKGTTTDQNGRYSLSVSDPASVLVYSMIGFTTEEVPVNGRSVIDIELVEDLKTLSEVVVTGYTAEKKADLTGAVSVVKVSEVKDMPSGNVMQNLQGRVAGVYITTSGNPGSGANVQIRGQGTLDGAKSGPLYVIDGIPTQEGMQSINQNDIESIQVLKDASAATIYGSRAGNGVIIITTKRAKKGVSRVDFSAYTTAQRFTSKLDMLDTEGRGRVQWQAATNDKTTPDNLLYSFQSHLDANGQPVLDKIVLAEFIDEQKTMRPANTRWFDEVSQLGLIQGYNLNLSNGGERGNMLFSLNYFNHDGIIKETNLNRITARMNSDYTFLNGKLKVGENLQFAKSRETLINADDIMYLGLVSYPIVPVHSLDGGWGGPGNNMTDRHNPVRLIEDNKQNKRHSGRVFGNAFIDLELLPKLHLRSNIGIDYTMTSQRVLYKAFKSGFLEEKTNRVTNENNFFGNVVWQNTLTYNLDLGKSRLDFLAGTEQIKFISQIFSASRENFALQTPDYMYLDAGSGIKDNGGSGGASALMSYFGKVNYSFNDRYLAALTVRRDGSSRFGQDNQYGIFPAFSLGWRLSEEAFLKGQVDVLSDLKLRFGWGKTGNQNIADNAIYALYTSDYGIDPTWTFDSGTAYDLSGANTGALPSGFRRFQRGNTSLKWESLTQSNYGVDFGFFDEKLTGSVDYFVKNTTDILIQPPYLAVVGEGGARWVNGASMQNKGIEIQLGYQGKVGDDISYSASGNVATYRNKVIDLPAEVVNNYGGNGKGDNVLGRSVNSIYGWVTDGLFQSQEEVDAHATQNGKGIGRIRYQDLNNDGKIDTDDRTWIGNRDPKYIYGFNASASYKNVDIAFFFQGVQGNDVYNVNKELTDFTSRWSGTNFGARTLDAWTPTNTGSTIPALTLNNNNDEFRTSTYFVENGSYLRLRNIQVGYNLPTSLVQRLKMQRIRVYLQGQNLLTLKPGSKSNDYTGVDPETPNQAYPIPAMYTTGINVSF